jgi:hypothetical protein
MVELLSAIAETWSFAIAFRTVRRCTGIGAAQSERPQTPSQPSLEARWRWIKLFHTSALHRAPQIPSEKPSMGRVERIQEASCLDDLLTHHSSLLTPF